MRDLTKIRWYVRIRAGKDQSLAESVYYRNDLSFQLLSKWMWYFKYREALHRVSYPRHYCELQHGSYDYTPPKEIELKNLRNRIINKKGKVTEYQSKLQRAEKTWNQLFPIHEYEAYKKCEEKINRLKSELEVLQTEYQDLLAGD
jgi:hypothetical protein